MERNWLDVVCLILIIIGAVNWGLIGFFSLDTRFASFTRYRDSRQISAQVRLPGSLLA